jgi:hypothetical protein
MLSTQSLAALLTAVSLESTCFLLLCVLCDVRLFTMFQLPLACPASKSCAVVKYGCADTPLSLLVCIHVHPVGVCLLSVPPSGIKVALPAESASGRCFLQLYIETILALEVILCTHMSFFSLIVGNWLFTLLNQVVMRVHGADCASCSLHPAFTSTYLKRRALLSQLM